MFKRRSRTAPPDAPLLVRWVYAALEWWATAALVVGAAIDAATNLGDSDERLLGRPLWIYWAVGTTLLAIGTFAQARRQVRVKRLQDDLDRTTKELALNSEAIKEFCRFELRPLSGSLNLQSTERISLFVVNGDYAYLVGRYSKWKTLMTSGRDRYPLDEGALGLAYRNSPGVMADLPDPNQDMEGWTTEMMNAGFSRKTCEEMSMKPRTCIAFQICATGGDAHPIGFVVFESQLTIATAHGEASVPRISLAPELLAKQVKRAEPRLRATLETALKTCPL